MTTVLDHAPRPGPGPWDWRCLTCGEPVDQHAGRFRRWRWRRWRRRVVRRYADQGLGILSL